MEKVKLNNGIEMPILGLGVYLMKDPKECEESVYNALKAGYRLIDTAASYGNEEAVGSAIKRSKIPREELFITTKLWVQDYGEESVLEAFERSLTRLGLDYIDLYLLHQPFGDVYGAWRALEKLYEQGKVRAIGVSNFYDDRLMDLMLHNKIIPAVNQIEINPFCQQNRNVLFMKNNNIQAESWSPLATGKNNIFENEILVSLANKYHRSVSQIILRWIIQRKIVVVTKASQKKHILENIEVFDFELSDGDMEIITNMNIETSVYFGKESHRDPETVKNLGTMIFNT